MGLSDLFQSKGRRIKLSLAALILLLVAALGGWWLLKLPPVIEEPEERLVLRPAQFSELPGWDKEDFANFAAAFFKSCDKIAALPAERAMGGDGMAGTAGDWQPICEQARALTHDPAAWRSFFEAALTPFSVHNSEQSSGPFTGYYGASLQG